MSNLQEGPRLHPGIIASVVFVILSAIVAAVLIIKKYCFPVNEASYRYSSLRKMEEEEAAADGQGPGSAREEESDDEELLE